MDGMFADGAQQTTARRRMNPKVHLSLPNEKGGEQPAINNDKMQENGMGEQGQKGKIETLVLALTLCVCTLPNDRNSTMKQAQTRVINSSNCACFHTQQFPARRSVKNELVWKEMCRIACRKYFDNAHAPKWPPTDQSNNGSNSACVGRGRFDF
jgi:hypothetical protein